MKDQTLKKVLTRVRKHWPALIGSLILATVYVVMTLYIPILVGDAIDGVIGAGNVDFTGLWEHLRMILICAGVAAASQWLMNEINNRITFHVTRDIRREAFAHIQELPLKYLDSHAHGDLLSRVVSDVDTFADGLLMGFTQL